MFNNMRREVSVGVEGQAEKLFPGERIENAQRLIDEFRKILQPKLDSLRNPSSRASYSDLLNTATARDAVAITGKGVTPIVVFQRGGVMFELINNVVTPEIETLALSVEGGKKSRKLVALSVERDPNDGSIRYITDNSDDINTADAVKGAKRVLRKLKHPLLSSLPFVFRRAA